MSKKVTKKKKENCKCPEDLLNCDCRKNIVEAKSSLTNIWIMIISSMIGAFILAIALSYVNPIQSYFESLGLASIVGVLLLSVIFIIISITLIIILQKLQKNQEKYNKIKKINNY